MTRTSRRSLYYATPQHLRGRPKVTVTLSPEAIARLEELAAELGTSKSDAVERLILAHPRVR